MYRSPARGLIFKVYRSYARDEHEREWDALRRLAPSGLAPVPVALQPPDEGPPVLVMRAQPGTGREPESMGPADLAAVAELHRRIHPHRAGADRLANSHPATVLRRARTHMSSWDDNADHLRAAPGPVLAAGAAARTWLASSEAGSLGSVGAPVFGRGDTHLRNYLWSGQRPTPIDFEDAGLTDASFELADLMEHASARCLPESCWPLLCDRYQLDERSRARAGSGRRLAACFWLVILERRAAQGMAPVNVTLAEQADRVLRLLGTPAK